MNAEKMEAGMPVPYIDSLFPSTELLERMRIVRFCKAKGFGT
jgi:hypothetical protein